MTKVLIDESTHYTCGCMRYCSYDEPECECDDADDGEDDL